MAQRIIRAHLTTWQAQVILNLLASEMSRDESEWEKQQITDETRRNNKRFYVHLGDTIYGALKKGKCVCEDER